MSHPTKGASNLLRSLSGLTYADLDKMTGNDLAYNN